MNMTLTDLTAVAEELRRVLPAKRLNKISQPANEIFVFRFYGRGEAKILLLSTEEDLSRIHLVSRHEGSGHIPSPFLMLLRKHLQGKRLLDLRQAPGERKIALYFENAVFLWDLATRHASLFLVTADGRPLGSHRKNTSVGWPEIPAGHPGMPQNGYPEEAGGKEPSPSLALEASYQASTRENQISKAQKRLLLFVEKLLKKTARKKSKQEECLKEALEAESLLGKGNLILSYLAEIPPHSTLLQVEGESVELNPRLSPSENAQEYFSKYKKKKEGRRILRERLVQTEKEIKRLESLRKKIEGSSSSSELDDFAAELEPLGFTPPERALRKSKEEPALQGFRRYRLPDGSEILVGKSNVQNEYLTFGLAAPDDLWFHSRATPGAHVLLRLKKPGTPQEKDILAAAQLAAHFSRGRNSTRLEVVCTKARYVRRARPHRPGLVTFEREKTYLVPPTLPDEARLIE
ncbi:MAG: NFACT RNA binding domain-containing protein [bacterium]